MIAAKYSFSWAKRILKEVQEKYPRGANLLMEILEIDEQKWSMYLAIGDTMWQVLRKLAQYLDTCHYYDGTPYTAVKVIHEIRENPYYKKQERLINRLDKLKKFDTLKEQQSREGAEGGEADRGPQPSSWLVQGVLWPFLKDTLKPDECCPVPPGVTQPSRTA